MEHPLLSESSFTVVFGASMKENSTANTILWFRKSQRHLVMSSTKLTFFLICSAVKELANTA